MSGNLKTLAIIPARGGSKGLPRKNLATLGGAPLIAWTIAAARQVPGINEVIVSTDDEEIAEVARKWGASVPFLRPNELAQDHSLIGDAISYTLQKLNTSYDIIMSLFPTHPFRSPGLIEDAIDSIKSRALGVNAATCDTNEPGDFVFLSENGPQPIFSATNGNLLRPHGLFTVSGRFPDYVFGKSGLDNFLGRARALAAGEKRFLIPEHYIFINGSPSLTDIDSAADLERAENVFQQGNLSWSPHDNKPKDSPNPFVPKVTPATIRSRYSAVISSSNAVLPLELATNPLAMEPAELRDILNCYKSLKDQDVVVLVGEKAGLPSTSPLDSKSCGPFINLQVLDRIGPGTGLAKPTIAYGWVFFDKTLQNNVGHSIGDIPGYHKDGKTYVELSIFETLGTKCRATAWSTNFDLLGRSVDYVFNGESWSEGDKRSLRERISVKIERDSNGHYLIVPSGTTAIEFQVFRTGSSEPTRGYAWDPIEFPGILEEEPNKNCWRNRLTGELVTGRQKVPPIFRWSGFVYVPKKLPLNSKWSITGDEKGFSNLPGFQQRS